MLKPFHPLRPGHEADPAYYEPNDGGNLLDLDPDRHDTDLHPCYGFKVTAQEFPSAHPLRRWVARCGGCRVSRDGLSEAAAIEKVRRHQEGGS